MEINFNRVSPGYFDAMGLRAVDGRVFDATDVSGALPAVIVNETMARRYWKTDRAVGRLLRLGPDAPLTVIGVVADVKYRMLREEAGPSFYLPIAQAHAPAGAFHIRTEHSAGLAPRHAPPHARPGGRRRAGHARADAPRAGRPQRHRRAAGHDHRAGVGSGGRAVGRGRSLCDDRAQRRSTDTRDRCPPRAWRRAAGCAAGWCSLRDSRWRWSAAWPAPRLGCCLPGRSALGSSALSPADAVSVVVAISLLAGVAVLASWLPARRAARVNPVDALRVE